MPADFVTKALRRPAASDAWGSLRWEKCPPPPPKSADNSRDIKDCPIWLRLSSIYLSIWQHITAKSAEILALHTHLQAMRSFNSHS